LNLLCIVVDGYRAWTPNTLCTVWDLVLGNVADTWTWRRWRTWW